MTHKQFRKGFLVTAALIGVALSIPIWRELGNQKAKTKLARADMAQELKTLSALKAERTRYKDPAAVEELLRERGYWEHDAKPWQPIMPKPSDDFGPSPENKTDDFNAL